jgi:hypothetical protein
MGFIDGEGFEKNDDFLTEFTTIEFLPPPFFDVSKHCCGITSSRVCLEIANILNTAFRQLLVDRKIFWTRVPVFCSLCSEKTKERDRETLPTKS